MNSQALLVYFSFVFARLVFFIIFVFFGEVRHKSWIPGQMPAH